MRSILKSLARAIATVVVLPLLVSYWLRSQWLGADAALEGSSQALALLPGLIGRYLRVAFLHHVLMECDPSAAIEFGTVFSQAGARIGPNVYIGPSCHIGLAHIEQDVLLAAGVHVPSGPNTHGIARLDVPIREQPGAPAIVRIGAGAWIGSAAIVMAEVGSGSVVGAGSVVTKPLPECVIAGGVPAKIIRSRRESGHDSV